MAIPTNFQEITMKKQTNKPMIETLINTVALALTALGVQQITTGSWKGYVAISFGMGLEFTKYWGRKNNYW